MPFHRRLLQIYSFISHSLLLQHVDEKKGSAKKKTFLFSPFFAAVLSLAKFSFTKLDKGQNNSRVYSVEWAYEKKQRRRHTKWWNNRNLQIFMKHFSGRGIWFFRLAGMLNWYRFSFELDVLRFSVVLRKEKIFMWNNNQCECEILHEFWAIRNVLTLKWKYFGTRRDSVEFYHLKLDAFKISISSFSNWWHRSATMECCLFCASRKIFGQRIPSIKWLIYILTSVKMSWMFSHLQMSLIYRLQLHSLQSSTF